MLVLVIHHCGKCNLPQRGIVCLCGVCLHVYQHFFFLLMSDQVIWTTIGLEDWIYWGKKSLWNVKFKEWKNACWKGGKHWSNMLHILVYQKRCRGYCFFGWLFWKHLWNECLRCLAIIFYFLLDWRFKVW